MAPGLVLPEPRPPSRSQTNQSLSAGGVCDGRRSPRHDANAASSGRDMRALAWRPCSLNARRSRMLRSVSSTATTVAMLTVGGAPLGIQGVGGVSVSVTGAAAATFNNRRAYSDSMRHSS